jgi:hypothetical protein
MRAKPTGSSFVKKLSSLFALLAVELGRLVYEFRIGAAQTSERHLPPLTNERRFSFCPFFGKFCILLS